MESDFSGILEARRVAILNLSERTGGNAIGLGNADIVTEKVFRAMDYEATLMNALTSLSLRKAFIPVRMPSDRKAIQACFTTIGPVPPAAVRAVVIRDTLHLAEFWPVPPWRRRSAGSPPPKSSPPRRCASTRPATYACPSIAEEVQQFDRLFLADRAEREERLGRLGIQLLLHLGVGPAGQRHVIEGELHGARGVGVFHLDAGVADLPGIGGQPAAGLHADLGGAESLLDLAFDAAVSVDGFDAGVRRKEFSSQKP